MKILQVTPFYPPAPGGISNHVQNVSKYLELAGDQIIIMTPRKLAIRKAIQDDNSNIIDIRSVFLPSWPYPTLKSVSIPIDFGSAISTVLKGNEFDIIHVHGHHYPISWIAIYLSRRYNIPAILTLHGMYALDPRSPEGKNGIEVFFNKVVFKRLLKSTTAVIGLTERITQYSQTFGIEDLIYRTIPNGIDTSIFQKNFDRKNEFRQKYGIKQNALVVLFRGRFEEVKGVIEFSRAVKRIHAKSSFEIEIVMVGGGSQEIQVKRILQDTRNVHIFDWQPTELLHEMYLLADIFVIPSKFEALPITIIEAMNSGLHIVYTPVGGLPEILEKYGNRTVLKIGSADEIKDVLLSLSKKPDLLLVSKESLDYARIYDWTSIVPQIRNLYLECQNFSRL